MKKYKIVPLFMVLFTIVVSVQSQNKTEREHRIKKCQFPSNARSFLKDNLSDVKNLKFYKETDSSATDYVAKFKKEKLHYSMQFSDTGVLQVISFSVGKIDIPEDSWSEIQSDIDKEFDKYKIKRIWQRYAADSSETVETVLKNAFQNLLLPEITYKIFVKGKVNRAIDMYEITYDANGSRLKKKKSLPANFDRVLY